jgi:hypothetical protein
MGNTDLFKHPKGTFERLTTTNYASWKNNMTRVLMALNAWEIVNGTKVEPADPIRGDYFDRRGVFNRAYFEYDVSQATGRLRNSE